MAARLGHPDSGADNKRTAGTLEHGAHGFDGASVELTAFRKLRPIVPKRDMKDGVGRSGTAAKAFQVFQIAAMDISASCGQRLGARVAARKTEHLVPAPISSGTILEPMKPVAPVTNTRIRNSFTSLQPELTKPAARIKTETAPNE